MSVENSSIIDFVSTDKNGAIVLTISDHLEWGCDNSHLLLLQEKISSYINAIESGDLFRKYPHAKDKKIIIALTSKFWPNSEAHTFLQRVKDSLNSLGYDFQYQNLIAHDK